MAGLLPWIFRKRRWNRQETVLSKNIFRTGQKVVLDTHVHMDAYADEGSVSLIMFNLGYLPGGDHHLATKAETTIEALKKGLTLLCEGGMISLLIYSGGDSGFDEKEQVLQWLKELSDDQYTVLVEAFYNKPNHPPLPVYIIKNETV